MSLPRQVKNCSKCNQIKNIINFYKRGKHYRSWCKQCEAKERNIYFQTDYHKQYRHNYYIKHKQNAIDYNREWKHSHPEIIKLRSSIRRQLGFIPLNEPFPGSVAHHIDNEHVLYIPEDIHKKCTYPNREEHRRRVNEFIQSKQE